jgi:hypothetical protein
MNESGIISQYGFLYQRKVFVSLVLENISCERSFRFEGKDDIDIASDEKIYEIDVANNKYIQVKSGSVSKNCFCRIIGNWLLLEDVDIASYLLYIENNLNFEIEENEILKEMSDFVQEGKTKKISSIARKVYEKYKMDIINDSSKTLDDNIKHIIKELRIEKNAIAELDLKMEEIFFDTYCSDITQFSLAKKKRLERFLDYVNRQIDESIKKKKTYKLVYQEFFKLVIQVCDEINDHSYKIDVMALRPKLIKEAEKIVLEGKKREINQLFLVDTRKEFVVKEIVNELFYQDFRSVYSDKKNLDISNLEMDAKENYDSAKFKVNNPKNPKELYEFTVSQELYSEILPKGPIYRKGCYIYLTGESVQSDMQITWGEDDEI